MEPGIINLSADVTEFLHSSLDSARLMHRCAEELHKAAPSGALLDPAQIISQRILVLELRATIAIIERMRPIAQAPAQAAQAPTTLDDSSSDDTEDDEESREPPRKRARSRVIINYDPKAESRVRLYRLSASVRKFGLDAVIQCLEIYRNGLDADNQHERYTITRDISAIKYRFKVSAESRRDARTKW